MIAYSAKTMFDYIVLASYTLKFTLYYFVHNQSVHAKN